MLPVLGVLDHIVRQNTHALGRRADVPDAAWRASDARGRSALWVLGHIVTYRHRIMHLAGIEPPTVLWSASVQPGTSAKDLPQHLSPAMLIAQCSESGDAISRRFAELPHEDLERHFGGTAADGSKTVFGALRNLVRHETLHVGHIGFLLAGT